MTLVTPDPTALAEALGVAQADGWLLYDFQGVNPVLGQVLGIGGMGSRRLFVYLPRSGEPVAVAHRFDAAPEEEVSIVGCLCTPLDLLADEVMLPRAEVGDVIAIFCAGAYGLTASPQAFLSQGAAREVLV